MGDMKIPLRREWRDVGGALMWSASDAVAQVMVTRAEYDALIADGLKSHGEIARLRSKLRRLGEAYKRLRFERTRANTPRRHQVTYWKEMYAAEIHDRQTPRQAEEFRKLRRHADAMARAMVDAIKWHDIGDDDFHEALSGYRRDFPIATDPTDEADKERR